MRLFWHELRTQQLLFWRNRESAVFIFVFPPMLFLLLGAVYTGNSEGFKLADHLLVGEIGRPAEGRTGAAPAVAAMADRIYQRRALDLDRAGAAAAARGHAAFAFSACATFEAGSRPSATQISRPAAAIASRSTPWLMPRPFIR